jgi:hypothetical protein
MTDAEESAQARECAMFIRAALSYERDVREQPQHPEAWRWREMARVLRECAELVIGWPEGTVQIPKRSRPRTPARSPNWPAATVLAKAPFRGSRNK